MLRKSRPMTAKKELVLLLGWIPVSISGMGLLAGLFMLGVLPLLSGAVGLAPLISFCSYALPTIGVFLLPVFFFPQGKRALRLMKRPFHPVGWGMKHYLLALVVAVAGFFVSGFLTELTESVAGALGWHAVDHVGSVVKEELQSGTNSFVALWIAMALLPAFAEELFFRGMMQPLFMRLCSGRAWLAILVTAVIFSILHFSWVGALGRVAIGCALGWLSYSSQGLRLPILYHLLNNTVALVQLSLEL